MQSCENCVTCMYVSFCLSDYHTWVCIRDENNCYVFLSLFVLIEIRSDVAMYWSLTLVLNVNTIRTRLYSLKCRRRKGFRGASYKNLFQISQRDTTLMHIMGRQDAINTTIRSLIYFHSLGVLKLVVCKKNTLKLQFWCQYYSWTLKLLKTGSIFWKGGEYAMVQGDITSWLAVKWTCCG